MPKIEYRGEVLPGYAPGLPGNWFKVQQKQQHNNNQSVLLRRGVIFLPEGIKLPGDTGNQLKVRHT
jgi:hypothetical protein